MDILEQLNSEINLKSDNNKEWLSLPSIEGIKEANQMRLITRDANPEVCSYILWNRVERDVLFTLPIPPGFVRNEEDFEIKIEVEKSFLRIIDEVVRKAAEIKIIGDDGNVVDMECSIDVIRKCMKGEIIFNIIGKGFKSKASAKIDEVKKAIYVDETAFTNTQIVLISQVLGYTCKDCRNSDKEEIAVTVTKGTPFITLPNGQKIEEESNINRMLSRGTVENQSEFDKLITGDASMVINFPCHILAELIIEPIS